MRFSTWQEMAHFKPEYKTHAVRREMLRAFIEVFGHFLVESSWKGSHAELTNIIHSFVSQPESHGGTIGDAILSVALWDAGSQTNSGKEAFSGMITEMRRDRISKRN